MTRATTTISTPACSPRTGQLPDAGAGGDRFVEDWGNWIEIGHDGGFALAVTCVNLDGPGAGGAQHRVATHPDRPFVRKLWRKIDVRSEVERLSAALSRILSGAEGITGLRPGP